MRQLPRLIAVALAVLLVPAVVGAARGLAANRSLYAPLAADVAGTPINPTPRPHDPDEPTAVVVIGAKGAEVSDVLAPFEVLATTDAFNVYTVAPARRPLPLTGGLHLVPDLTFDELDARLGTGGAADVVVVPALPDADEPSTAPVTRWLRRQAGDGALIVGVCAGARVVASAGLLDGRDATSHWARLDDIARAYPEVTWVRGTRYVDAGDVITTGGLLSNIDGTLRAVERLVDTATARRTAAAVGWRHYSPGRPAAIPALTLGPDAVLKPLNAAYRRGTTGVVLTDAVGEMELASVFDAHSGQSFATRTVAVAASRDAVTSRHGLTFVPTSDLHSVGDDLDRLLVPGADAARHRDPDLAAHALGEHALTPEYLHTRHELPYDAALRDLAATADVPTARWAAKVLEHPADDLRLIGSAWPWALTWPPLLLAAAGSAVAAAAAGILRRRRARPATSTPAGPGPAAVDAPPNPRPDQRPTPGRTP